MRRLVNYLFSADKNELSKMATRINKYLSEVGYCSRRVADRLIEEGKVTINGDIPEIGSKVEEGDQVEVKGIRIEKLIKQKKYI